MVLTPADFTILLAAPINWEYVTPPLKCHLATQWAVQHPAPIFGVTSLVVRPQWPREYRGGFTLPRAKFSTAACPYVGSISQQ